MKRDWNEIEGKTESTEREPGTVHQPLENDTWTERVSRLMNGTFTGYPEVLAQNPVELFDQIRNYIYSLKSEWRKIDESFKEYRCSHPDREVELYNHLQDEKARLSKEVQRLLIVNEALDEGTKQRDAEIEKLRRAVVELQDRLDRAKTQG